MLARLHVVVRTDPAAAREYDVAAIEARLARGDAHLVGRPPRRDDRAARRERAASLYPRYAGAFPPAYQADFSPRVAVADIQRIERLDPEGAWT